MATKKKRAVAKRTAAKKTAKTDRDRGARIGLSRSGKGRRVRNFGGRIGLKPI